MIRTYEGTTRLQGIGIVEGIKAKNIKVGDELVWNYGGTSKVVAIEFSKTGKTLTVTTEYNGELYERRMTAERIVVVKELNPVEEIKEAAVVEEEVEAVETEEMTANFEEAKKWLNYVREYKDMKYYGEAQVYYSRYRKAGGKQIIEHLEHPERYKELLEESEEIQEVVEEVMGAIINQETTESASGEAKFPKYKERFYCKAGNTYIGCDNSNNDAWVEEFEAKAEVIAWLESEEDAETIKKKFASNKPKKERKTAFQRWLERFIEEKGLDLNSEFTVKHKGIDHFITLGFLTEAMTKAPKQEQEQIKDKIVYIDFRNGNVIHFFEFLAKAYIKTNF